MLGVIECFFMPGRVRAYNAVQAAGLAATMGLGVPGWVGFSGYTGWAAPVYAQSYMAPTAGYFPPQTAVATDATLLACSRCGCVNHASARFCTGCGQRYES